VTARLRPAPFRVPVGQSHRTRGGAAGQALRPAALTLRAAGSAAGSALRAGGLAAALALAAVVVSVGTVAAQERILAYHIEVDVLPDGDLEVAEHITIVAEGRQVRRGIYRDFPTRYRDRYGNRVRVGLEVLGVERDGRPEAWFTERVANGVRINTGSDDFLPVPARYTFTLRYRTTRQLGFFRDHDELYWNAIGTGWVFPIEQGTVEVRLPEPVPVEAMSAEGYTGPQGARGTAYTAQLGPPGVARYTLTAPLAPREGLTIVLTFPKGVVPEPARGQRAFWFLRDNRGALVALAGLLALLVFATIRWVQIGRDPRPGVVIPRYFPPKDRTPAALRYLRRMGYDNRCFSSDLLDLAVAGHLSIHQKDPPATGLRRFLQSRRPEWWLERNGADPALAARPTRSARPAQQEALAKLFPAGARRLELKDSNHAILQGAETAHRKALDRELHPRFFQRNTSSVVIAVLIAVFSLGLAFAVSGGHGIPILVGAVMAAGVTILVFGTLVRAPTPEGRALLDEIEGLKLYLGVAEVDELARMPGPGSPPPLDAERYEALLPYAVALEVEDAWTTKFTAAVGAAAAAAATSAMTWYSGGRITDLGSFSRSLGEGLTSQIASASSPPGSSSGSGGGGSSGGGGGGGGGGGR
jgi:uncharacterized membrane protein YgcG